MKNKTVYQLEDEVLRTIFYLQRHIKSTVPMIEAYLKVFTPLYSRMDTFDIRDALSYLIKKELIVRNMDIYKTYPIAVQDILFKNGDHIIYLKDKEQLTGKIQQINNLTFKVLNDKTQEIVIVSAISVVGFKTINGYEE